MRKRIVISNTTPILYLNKLKLLKILKEIFKEVCIPEAVLNELEALGFYITDDFIEKVSKQAGEL